MSNNENNYSDSTNNTNKLLQQNDKGSLEENFTLNYLYFYSYYIQYIYLKKQIYNYSYYNNYTNISNIELEINEFKPPKYEIKWNISLQNTYHFKQDIERVWLFLRSFEFICLLSNEGHYPCINIKGKDTWKIGNTFKVNLYNIYPFVARVEKVLNFPEMKEIKWLFNNNIDNNYYEVKLNLYKVTEDNSTVVLRTIKSEKNKINNFEKKNIINIF